MIQTSVVGHYDVITVDMIRAAYERLGRITQGELPSQTQIESAMFHLTSMRQEKFSGSGSKWAAELALRIDPLFLLEPYWAGEKPEDMLPAEVIIAANPQRSKAETIEALAFYDGSQWKADVSQKRYDESRPALVVNRLPGLVAAAISKSTGKLSRANIEALTVAVTINNMDAQRAFNYAVSFMAETQAIESDRRRGVTK